MTDANGSDGNRRSSRLYTREQGGAVRYYGDFRDFADVGGKREALIPRGAALATTDEKLAQALVADRIAHLEARRRFKQRGEPEEKAYLAEYAIRHLRLKRESGRFTDQWLEAAAMHLEAALTFFCNSGKPLPRERELSDITVADVEEYVAWLAKRPNGRRNQGCLSQASQRKYLNSLSNLYRRAIGEGRVRTLLNPVAALMDKPQDSDGRGEAKWLEVHEAALLLEAARLYAPMRPKVAMSPRAPHALIATMLLTGGRPNEVYGLTVEDISLERRTVTFRTDPTRRRLKTANSKRVVPLWPQLEDILREYLGGDDAPKAVLLFRSHRTGEKIGDIRKALDTIAVAAGWEAGGIPAKSFRHTYCAARLQTLDRGFPMSEFTVGRELGHGGAALVRKVSGHLGEVRHRSRCVEYRVGQHRARLKERLAKLQQHMAMGR